MSVVNFNAVIYCQSTDLNGLPTSIEIILTTPYKNEEIDRLYLEIAYPQDVQVSPIAHKMFVKRDGVEPISSELAIYKFYQFMELHSPLSGGTFRPVVHGLYSLEVLRNFIKYTNYVEFFKDTFNSIIIDTMSYALLINNYVSAGSPTNVFPYASVNTESPSVAYLVVAEAENVPQGVSKAEGTLLIYKNILKALTEDFKTLTNLNIAPNKCPECGANTYEKKKCFICGFSGK